EIAEKYSLTINNLQNTLEHCKKILLEERNKRERPRLDDKSLTSWNALMLKGYIDAYKAFGCEHYLKIAENNATFLINNQLKEDGGLYHNYKNGKSNINGFLED